MTNAPTSHAPFFILSVDGGGIRGAFPAHLLHKLSEAGDIEPRVQFDFFAGTSTGSIIAAATAIGVSPADIVSLYRELGAKIFRSPIRSPYPKNLKFAVHSKYRNTGLRSALKAVFGEHRLGDVSVPLLLPAVDIGNGGVHVFKSQYDQRFTRDAEVRVVDAVLASCAAPVFFDPVTVDNYLLCDGGLWANNPALAATVDAQHRLNIDPERLRVLSLGTGHARTEYGTQRGRKWGFANGWGHKKFIEFMMSLQSQSTTNYLKLLLAPHQVLRLNFESDRSLPLDDAASVDDLISRADRVFTYESEPISKFLAR